MNVNQLLSNITVYKLPKSERQMTELPVSLPNERGTFSQGWRQG